MAMTPPINGSGSPDGPSAGRVTGRARVPSPADAQPVSPAAVGAAWGGRAPVTGRASVGGRQPGGGTPTPSQPPVYGGKKKLKPKWGRIALVGSLVLLLIAGIGGFATWMYVRGLEGNLDRIDPFSEISGGRPAKVADGAINILMLGSDSRDPDAPKGEAGTARTDTIVVMHIPSSHDKAYVISLPRDLWVHVPENPNGPGDQMAKINSAYAWGGSALMIRTVEEYTGVRMDHLAVIDFYGFIGVTNALGGVTLNIERDFTSIHPPYHKYKKGPMHLDGSRALDYIRQRKQFPEGDFARMRHQQEFLKALMDKAVSTGTLAKPGKLNAFLQSVTKAMTVDKDFALLDMAWQFRGLRSENLVFMTSPHNGTDTIDGQSVVVSDREKASGLFDAVTNDKVADWLAANPASTPGPGG
jgi:LCP family protein required for cell wall assembly